MSDSETPNVCSFDERRPELAPYGLTCVRWRPNLMRRPDRHNELEINLLRSGTLTYLLGGRRVTVEPGRLTVFWALVPHQIIHFEGEGCYYVATIPFPRFLQWQMPPAFLNQIMAGAVLKETNGDVARLDEAMFDRWLQDVGSNSREAVDVMMLEMEARLRRLVLSYETACDRDVKAIAEGLSRADRSTSKVEQMAVFVAAHYREPILVREIGEAVGLHPDYANALFREAFGMTLSDYLLEHRIAHAQRMLATTSEKSRASPTRPASARSAGSTRPSRPPPAVRLPSIAGDIFTRTASETLLLPGMFWPHDLLSGDGASPDSTTVRQSGIGLRTPQLRPLHVLRRRARALLLIFA